MKIWVWLLYDSFAPYLHEAASATIVKLTVPIYIHVPPRGSVLLLFHLCSSAAVALLTTDLGETWGAGGSVAIVLKDTWKLLSGNSSLLSPREVMLFCWQEERLMLPQENPECGYIHSFIGKTLAQKYVIQYNLINPDLKNLEFSKIRHCSRTGRCSPPPPLRRSLGEGGSLHTAAAAAIHHPTLLFHVRPLLWDWRLLFSLPSCSTTGYTGLKNQAFSNIRQVLSLKHARFMRLYCIVQALVFNISQVLQQWAWHFKTRESSPQKRQLNVLHIRLRVPAVLGTTTENLQSVKLAVQGPKAGKILEYRSPKKELLDGKW